MLIILYILPWLLFLFMIGTLFINVSKPKRILLAIPLLLLGVLFAIILNIKIVHIQSDQDTLYNTLHERALIEQKRNHKEALLTAQVMAFQTQNDDLFYPYSQLGMTFETQHFKRILHVDDLLQDLLGEDPMSKTNHNIQIYRLPSDINQILVAEYLHGLGYQIYLPEPPVPDGLGDVDLALTEEDMIEEDSEAENQDKQDDKAKADPSQQAKPDKDLLQHKLPGVTVSLRFARKSVVQPPLERPALPKANHILFGRKVSAYDMKVISLALLRAGVELRAVKKIPKIDNNTRDLHIELDWSNFYSKKPIINAEKLIKKRSFK